MVVVLLVHFTLWLVVAYGLLVKVPACERVFKEFGMKLPWFTQMLLNITNLVTKFSLFLVPAGTTLFFIDGAVLFLLWHRLQTRLWGWLWAVLTAFVPAWIILILIFGLMLPMFKLLE